MSELLGAKQKGFTAIELIIVVAIAVLIPAAIYAAYIDGKNWEEFSSAHSCKVIEKVSATTSTGYGYGMTTGGKYGYGMITTTTPEKTGYKCDDGVVYWR